MRELQDEFFEFGRPKIKAIPPSGVSYFDKQRCKPKELHEFIIKGKKIMASSRKDALKRYNHLKEKKIMTNTDRLRTKEKLEKDILQLIQEFNKETGYKVVDISTDKAIYTNSEGEILITLTKVTVKTNPVI